MVIKGVLSEGEVGRLNDAIDRHSHLITRPPDSYSHGSPAMRGENNLITKLARQLLALEEAGAGAEDLAAAGDTMAAAYSAAGEAQPDSAVTLGSLRAALTTQLGSATDRVESLMSVAEQSVAAQHLPQPEGVTGDNRVVQLGTSRGDLGGMLQWEDGDAEPFRELLCHPRIKPALETILGTHYRMDHMPDLMTMDAGDDGHYLHGGNYEAFGRGGTLYSYAFHGGRMHSGMLVVEYMLADEGPGDGGVAVVQGSHSAPTDPEPLFGRQICSFRLPIAPAA